MIAVVFIQLKLPQCFQLLLIVIRASWKKNKTELTQFDMALVYAFKHSLLIHCWENLIANLLGIKLKHLIATLLQTADN